MIFCSRLGLLLILATGCSQYDSQEVVEEKTVPIPSKPEAEPPTESSDQTPDPAPVSSQSPVPVPTAETGAEDEPRNENQTPPDPVPEDTVSDGDNEPDLPPIVPAQAEPGNLLSQSQLENLPIDTKYMTGDIKEVFAGDLRLSGCSKVGDQLIRDVFAAPTAYFGALPIDAMGLGSTANSASAQVPLFLITGAFDNLSGNSFAHDLFLQGRALGAPWVYMQRPKGHCGVDQKSREVMALFLTLTEYIRTHGRTSGYHTVDVTQGYLGGFDLVRNETTCHPKESQLGCTNYSVTNAWIAPYADFVGDRQKASWLPNQEFAERWLDLMNRSKVTPTQN